MKDSIRVIPGEQVIDAAAALYTRVCTSPSPDVLTLLKQALAREPEGPGREALVIEIENMRIAGETGLPICQDTGTAIVFAELGNRVVISGGTLAGLVSAGIGQACRSSWLRPSQVFPPLTDRENTGDNTPAVVHMEHVEGSSLKLSLMAKGAGCENVSRSAMLLPAQGIDGVAEMAMDCIRNGASRACPPVFLGIGIGGTQEISAILAKKALLRPAGTSNPLEELRKFEERITRQLNATGIGPQGFGGRTTVLETRMLQAPCHMASLPVTVCVECHAHRTASCVI